MTEPSRERRKRRRLRRLIRAAAVLLVAWTAVAYAALPLAWRRYEHHPALAGRAMVTRPRLLVLDESTEGIQPSIIQDIGRAIKYLRDTGEMAIVLVEQYYDFARDLCDSFYVMDRGQIVKSGVRADMVDSEMRELLSV